MQIGVAYYPEHWPEERWPVDARLMRETGIDVVRVGEFAWSRMEPRRGQYCFDWLAKAISVLAEAGLKVILCTPTAAPPPWLFVRHPSMVPVDAEGKAWFRGSRRHACLNNRPYRRYVRRIVRELARNLGKNPHVFAWQIDNEIGCHGSGVCYCEDCEQAFREWLKRRYGTIERLNRLWGTAFWSQEFNDWHEIPAPRRTPAGVHPSLALDYKRFVSATVRDFVLEQKQLIREYSNTPRPVTTNCLGLHTSQIDQFSLGRSQDVASVDNYPVDGRNLDSVCEQLDLTRAVKGGPFWVLEQQAGSTMIPARHSQPRPGQLRLWSFQAAARGARLISYFRWRTCPFAQEMHWYGLLDPDGAVRQRYDELKSTIAELKQASELLEGWLPDTPVAMVLDYAALWALEADAMVAGVDYLAQFNAFYGLLRRAGQGVRFAPPGEELTGHKLAVVTMPVIGRAADAGVLQRFVHGGGVLLVTAPAGYRTENNTWLMRPPPGPLAELLGVETPEHDVLGQGVENRISFGDAEVSATGFCALPLLAGAETLATYADGLYRGRPAVTRNTEGQGTAYFVAATGEEALYRRVLEFVLAEAELRPAFEAGDEVEVVPLRGPEDQLGRTFVLNHSDATAEIVLPAGTTYRELLTGTEYAELLSLEPYGVALLEQ